MEGERFATMVLAMNLLMTIVLMQTVGSKEKIETGRNLRLLTEHVEELEGVEGNGDLVVSRAIQVPTDEEATKEQIALQRIRETFLSFHDRQSPDGKRKEKDETEKDTVQKSSNNHEPPPADQKGRKRPPTSNIKEAIKRRTLQKREETHIMNLIERHRGQRRREREKRRSRNIDSANVNNIVQFNDSGDQEHVPYLELDVEPKTIYRQRRSISTSVSEMENSDYSVHGVNPPATAFEEECDDATEHCCLRSMTVDFESVGMRWIISPRSFQVTYCKGQCSTVPTDVRPMSPGLAAAIADRKGAGLCCVPVEYTDQDVVYYDDKMQVVSGSLKNFNVIRCGCL